MNFSLDELARSYAKKSDSELMGIAAAYDTLTSQAQEALRTEFASRKLEPPNIDEGEESYEALRRLVTIRRYRDLSEAIVARTYLESAGIRVFLRDENLVRLDWQVSNFIGGIRLQVETADEAAAMDMLAEPMPESINFGDQDQFQQPHCQRCGSTDITFDGSARGVAITSVFLLGIPLPLGKETWRCNSCEARWVDDDASPSEAALS